MHSFGDVRINIERFSHIIVAQHLKDKLVCGEALMRCHAVSNTAAMDLQPADCWLPDGVAERTLPTVCPFVDLWNHWFATNPPIR